jgi:hypothetical protein
MSKFCFHCPADLSHYAETVQAEEIPKAFRFDVPGYYSGQAIEYAFGTTDRGQATRGDLYMRRTDYSVAPTAITFFIHE